jgi:hypothetical protein
MEKTIEKLTEQRQDYVSDKPLSDQERPGIEVPAGAVVKHAEESVTCTIQGNGWLKGALGMAVCCTAPLLLFAAIAFFGLSLGALASGALSLVALVACPVGMFLMMRMMMKNKN